MYCRDLETRCQWMPHLGRVTQWIYNLFTERREVARAQLSMHHYSSARDLPPSIWDRLVSSPSLTAQRAYLESIEDEQGSSSHYFIFRDEGRPVGVAHFTLTAYETPSVAELMTGASPLTQRLTRWSRLGDRALSGQLLMCGGSSDSGGPGVVFNEGLEPKLIADALARAVDEVKRRCALRGEAVNATLFQGSPHLSGLSRAGYTRFEAEPMMTLTLSPRWLSYADYLGALTSKYRVKAKRADAKSAQLESRRLSPTELTTLKARLSHLYLEVTQRADLHIAYPEVHHLSELTRALPEHIAVYGYWLNSALVGYRVSLKHQGVLYAHLVGFDYAYNREHSIYPRILNDYVREGIERGCRAVCFGRTAGEIKSTLGAAPEPTHIYLRYSHRVVDRLLPMISRRVSLPQIHLHRPFRVEDDRVG